MAFTPQDDTGTVADANAYIDEDEFSAYHTDRGTDVSGYDEEVIQAAIVKATTYLDARFRFVGQRLNAREQSTEWPRSAAKDRDGRLVLGIPREIKNATAEYALRAITDELCPDPVRSDTGIPLQALRQTTGPFSESATYVPGGQFELPHYPMADLQLLRSGLVRTGGIVVRGD